MMDLEDKIDEEMSGELGDMVAELRAAKNARIESIGKLVTKRRDEAVSGRKATGIEQIWQEDEEYYIGIDDACRDHVSYLKSPSTVGGISRAPELSGNRCTAFFNVTRQFVDSGTARMADILLPNNDWNFAVKPSPVQDDLEKIAMELGGDPQQAADDKSARQREAQDKAEVSQKQIQDWLVECQYTAQVRQVIEDAGRIGTGVLKGPVPKIRKLRKTQEKDGKLALIISDSVAPVSKWVDPRNCFPDPNCGSDIQNGAYFIERDYFNARQLKDLKKDSSYLAEAIDSVLDEGPNKCNYCDGVRDPEAMTKDEDRFELWYYYGLVDLDGLDALNVDTKMAGGSKHSVPAIVVMVNETPIKAFLNPLSTGEYPFDFFPWQARNDSPWGIGIARQGRTPQDMINSAARSLMENGGLSKAPQLILRQKAIRPADNNWTLYGGKIWYATEEVDIRSVSDAFMSVNIPMMQQELNAIIELGYKMMEDATGIRFLLQGEQGSAPDTVGGMELLNRNASAGLRRLARMFDEKITEPHIRRYYVHLMEYGPEEAKGDVVIEAVGSTALVERDIQAIESLAILQMSINPAFGLDPEKAMTQVLIAKRMIPDKWQLTEEQKKAAAEQPPPADPAIEVAKIRSQTDLQIAQQREQTSQHKIQVDTDRDTVYVQAQTERDQATYTAKIEELRIKRELALLEYANKRDLTLDQIKADLAKETMRLTTQKELAGIKVGKAPQVATPAVEPPQHAPDGRAFQE
jgi:hypothetical protein